MSHAIWEHMFRLEGRVAVVTGAGGGLGRVFARALALYGAGVICADSDNRDLDEMEYAERAQGEGR